MSETAGNFQQGGAEDTQPLAAPDSIAPGDAGGNDGEILVRGPSESTPITVEPWASGEFKAIPGAEFLIPSPSSTPEPLPPPGEAAAEWVALDAVHPWPGNPRENDEAVDKIARSISRWGWGSPILARRANGEIIAGHTRYKAAQKLGLKAILVRFMDLSEDQAHQLAIADNRLGEEADWSKGALAKLLEGIKLEDEAALADIGFDDEELQALSAELVDLPDEPPVEVGASLADRFIVPPFSILDAQQGYWQDRKRAWLSIGLKSEEGRPSCSTTDRAMENMAEWCADKGKTGYPAEAKGPKKHSRGQTAGRNSAMNMGHGRLARKKDETRDVVSIFDPVLCEITYRWFSPKAGHVLDPFAGGSVRGIIAARCGRSYVGIDLRPEQVEANRAQVGLAGGGPPPIWIAGDSLEILKGYPSEPKFDLVFSCPPYADLERYSDNPLDLSTMEYPAFLAAYRAIIAMSVAMLKPDRFAVFVVGEVRGAKAGGYRGFVLDTIRAFEDAGATYYNEIILATAIGTIPLRAPRMFLASRKIGKRHQNVLVFVKGDAKKAAKACGEIEVPSDEELLEMVAEESGIELDEEADEDEEEDEAEEEGDDEDAEPAAYPEIPFTGPPPLPPEGEP